jgi:lipopolysaccharide/colanic/teichoic acid biosynthesis glycosyltransferase
MRIFHFILPVRISGLLFSELALAIACYLAATFATFRGGTFSYLRDDLGLVRILLVSLSILIGLFVNNLYADTRVESRVAVVLKMCNVFGIALIVQGLLAYISSGLGLSRLVMLLGSAIAFTLLVSWRIFYGTVLHRILRAQRILFIGKDDLLNAIADRIGRHPELGVEVCGHVQMTSDLPKIFRDLRPNRIVVANDEQLGDLSFEALREMLRCGVRVEEAASAYESICGRVSTRNLSATQIIFGNELASRPGSIALQSIYTNLVGLAGFIIFLPLLALVALAVKLTSRGPVFEQDVRVGQHEVPFRLNKFRCHHLAGDQKDFSLEERLTAVGHWLKKLHLVHLPYVINLLRGEISLVGPRPEKAEFVDELSQYFPYYRQRHSVKPGITGWGQINTSSGEQSTDTLRQLEYDLYYTKHISLALDAYILLHGIRQLLPFARN